MSITTQALQCELIRNPTDLELRGAVQLLNAIEDRIYCINPIGGECDHGSCEICTAVAIIVALQGQIHDERKERECE